MVERGDLEILLDVQAGNLSSDETSNDHNCQMTCALDSILYCPVDILKLLCAIIQPCLASLLATRQFGNSGTKCCL